MTEQPGTGAALLVGDFPRRGLAAVGGRPAVISDDFEITYADLAERVDRWAGFLQRRGLGPGNRLALLAPNTVAFLEAVLAASLIGATVVPLNLRLSPNELAFQVGDATARLTVVDPALAGLAQAAGIPPEARLVADDALSAQVAAAPAGGAARPGDDSELIQLYTSGTTGRPKGCLLTERAWLASVARLAHALAVTEEDRVLTTLPFFHVAGLHLALTTLATGAALVLPGSLDPTAMWSLIARTGTTIASFPFTQGPMLDHDDAPKAGATLRLHIGTLDPRFEKVLPWMRAITAYGMTEAAGIVTVVDAAQARERPGAVGRPFINVEVRIAGRDDAPVPTGEVGEILLRGPGLTSGYWQLPEATAETLRNGWLHTGDLGRIDADGFVYFVDRAKDMVKTGGENVYPLEVETVLAAHPAVADCAVVGVPDERWGEAVKAWVVPSGDVTPEDLDEWCSPRMGGFKRPRWYQFTDQIPRNATGKILKRELRRQHDATQAVRLPERSG